MTPGWRNRGYLPHLVGFEQHQHLTFRLGDTLPQSVVERIRLHYAEDADEARRERKIRRHLHTVLDGGTGCCALRDSRAAELVAMALQHFDGQRYALIAWVIMPNHVHALIATPYRCDIGAIVRSWKSYTSRRIAALGLMAQPVWYRDYWDRYIRDDAHLARTIAYIEENPVQARLVTTAAAWPWGSARTLGTAGLQAGSFEAGLEAGSP